MTSTKVQQSLSLPIIARRASGIDRISNEAGSATTITKGRSVIASRMKAASGKQVAGYRPYREALLGLDLPAKTTDPMQNLINRAGAVVMKMVEVKDAIG